MSSQPLTTKQKQDYQSLFQKMRRQKSSADDMRFEKAHSEVFAGVDCLQCANCCKTHSPIILQADIRRISKYLRISEHTFMSQYLLIDEDDDWVFHTQPCPFLSADNYCSIYAVRPKACAEYPHTNRKRMYQLEKITVKNAEICPAVTRILDNVIAQISA